MVTLYDSPLFDLIPLRDAIASIIAQAERFRGCRFWTPASSAGGRRSYERQNNRPRIEWSDTGRVYSAEFEVRCSCSHIYAKGYYNRDGVKTTLTAIKSSYKRICAEIERLEAESK